MMNRKEHSILDHLAKSPDIAHSSCKLSTLQNIILATDGQLLAQGKLYEIVGKRMCPGVYRISLELSK